MRLPEREAVLVAPEKELCWVGLLRSMDWRAMSRTGATDEQGGAVELQLACGSDRGWREESGYRAECRLA